MKDLLVGVIGYLGNMGHRYCAILDSLKIEYVGCDFHNKDQWKSQPVTHFIIATPTETHLGVIRSIRAFHAVIPILCEKPFKFCFDQDDLDDVKNVVTSDRNLFMVNNYYFTRAYWPKEQAGKTSYNYYHSGPHGLPWDCIQLVNLAKGDIELKAESPVWSCQINGVKVTRSSIDKSYVAMVKAFVTGDDGLWRGSSIIDAHVKTMDLSARMYDGR